MLVMYGSAFDAVVLGLLNGLLIGNGDIRHATLLPITIKRRYTVTPYLEITLPTPGVNRVKLLRALYAYLL